MPVNGNATLRNKVTKIMRKYKCKNTHTHRHTPAHTLIDTVTCTLNAGITRTHTVATLCNRRFLFAQHFGGVLSAAAATYPIHLHGRFRGIVVGLSDTRLCCILE